MYHALLSSQLLTNGLQALYWATSEWSAREIEEAHREIRPANMHSSLADVTICRCGLAPRPNFTHR